MTAVAHVYILPYRSNGHSVVAKIKVVIPPIILTEPINPRCGGSAMEFEEELLK